LPDNIFSSPQLSVVGAPWEERLCYTQLQASETEEAFFGAE